MDEELARFEEKQKIANFQIDKRLATIELGLEAIKSDFETISIPKNIDERFSKIENTIKILKDEIYHIFDKEKQEMQQIKELTKKYDIDVVKNDFDKLLGEVAIMKSKMKPVEDLDRKLAEIDKMKQMMNIEMRGKLPQCKEDIEQVGLKIKILDEKIRNFSSRLDQIASLINSIAAVQPIIIE